MIVIGLTGSIGMGKTTTAKLLEAEGAKVFDADAAVDALYAKGGKAVPAIGEAFPGCVVGGAVDRDRLSRALQADPDGFARLEKIVHPLVSDAREAFIAQARSEGAAYVVMDVPLLFETGLHAHVDKVMVVTAPARVQRERVLARPGMHPDKLDAILARQTPDSRKRERADYVIDTSKGIEDARRQVREALKDMTAKETDAQ